MYQLRQYQQEAVEAGLRVMRGHESGILALPTGSGKSLVIASIARELEGDTLVLQPTREILEQNLEKARAFGFDDIGVFSASAGRKDIGKLTFGTIGSVKNRRDEFSRFKNIIVDECHAVNAKGGMYKDFVEWSGGRLLGLSATPYRLHSFEDMKTHERAVVAKILTRTRPRMFENVSYVVQPSKLLTEGFLCDLEYIRVGGYERSRIKLNSTKVDYDQDDLFRYNEEFGLARRVSDVIRECGARHVLVFTAFVEEAVELAAALKDYGLNAATVSATTPKAERDIVVEDFRSGMIDVVTNVGVLTTGFDFPELDCVVLARPTRSVALYYQMVGRCVRVAEGKQKATVVDFCGNLDTFGRVETFEIVEPRHKLHRLKSEKGFLTGVDFVSGEDFELRDYKGVRESTGAPTNIVQFGKYKGQHITKLPNDYLRWCIGEFKDGRWKRAFMQEAARRKLII